MGCKNKPQLNLKKKKKKKKKKRLGEAVETSKREEVKKKWQISRAGRLLTIR